MKIKFSTNFYFLLNEIVNYIAKDKPRASRKFKKDLIIAIKKDLQFPYNYKKSVYFDEDTYRDYVHKGYAITYQINNEDKLLTLLALLKINIPTRKKLQCQNQ
jgi:plasmid stabilization system protein ParE